MKLNDVEVAKLIIQGYICYDCSHNIECSLKRKNNGLCSDFHHNITYYAKQALNRYQA
jgi:hypothetical protein